MKKIALIIAVVLFSTFSKAQQHYNDYDKLWKKVKQFEKENLPKSALKIVDEIFTNAKKDTNAPQVTKALLYKSKYALILEEDAQLAIVYFFKTEISTTEFPTKNILESVLANLYWQYFQQNRYQFYNRTETTKKIDSLDFRTWDLQTLFKEIHVHFQNSIKNGLVAQQTDLNNFNDILDLQKDSKKYRPTLFDFLNNNALDFYKTTETSITNPAYKFEISEEKLLKNYNVFSMLQLASKDSLSLQLNALKIYQKLSNFHQRENNKAALILITLERLKFVHKHAVFQNKDTLLLNTLIELKNEFNKIEASTLIDFEMASMYNKQADAFVPITKTVNQFKRVKALEIYNNAINQFPESIGAKKCTLLKQQIEIQSFKITAEKYIPINTYSKVYVTYKNTEQLYLQIYTITEKQQQQFKTLYNNLEKIGFIKNLKLVTQFSQTLKTENDYQNHSTEISIPTLQNNSYVIVALSESELNENSVYATSLIQVTNIAVIENNHNQLNNYQIVNRNTGKPLVGANVNIKNHNTGKYNKPYHKNYITDSKGQLKFKTNEHHRNIIITVHFNNEVATFGEYYLNEFKEVKSQPDKITIKPFIFTDRSIYRPGQIVYFKGIFIEKDGKTSTPLINNLVNAELYNANNEKIKELVLNTNEFGSVSGEFILPMKGLLGQYSILLNKIGFASEHFYFSVEEYKRPKFKAEFNPISETYKINDSIILTGSAFGFSGSIISDAKVIYRVHRKVQYPRWVFWRNPNFMISEAQEISHGETSTDNKGNFNIIFKAIPDKSIDKENLPIFNYEITADVTDINGETRSATAIVKVGCQALIAQINISDKIDKNKKVNSILIATKNLNNEIVSAKGIVKIFKLQAPKNVLRKRPWQAPDYQIISKVDYQTKFPHDAYLNEDAIVNWPKEKLVFEHDFDTSKSTELKLDNLKKWLSGSYIVELKTNDKFGQMVTDKQFFTVFDTQETEVADKQLFEISYTKKSFKPFENVILKLGSASENVFITLDVEKNHTIVNTQIIQLSNEIKTIKIPVTENDFGGFAIHYSFSNFNSFENGTLPISVPYPMNELEIETVTFRDKLQPGQNETWSFKLIGNKGEKVATELLASMYDASLDQFKTHNWQFNPIEQHTYFSYYSRNAHHSFGNTYFKINNSPRFHTSYPQQHFDKLNWFGFRFNTNLIRIRGLSEVKMSQKDNNIITIAEDSDEVEEMIMEDSEASNEVVATGYEKEDPKFISEEKIAISAIKIRENFQETAFFYPHLRTDTNGNVSFNFTVPEALTTWKLQLLGHTKELASTTKTLTTITQKELMVIPNPPRFLREGDEIIFSSKISNLTNTNLYGVAKLLLTDAITGKEINEQLGNALTTQTFQVNAKGNSSVSWKLQIPKNIQAVQYKVIAKAGDFSDGEQSVLPVLSNRMLVTETLPMWIRSNQTKTFSLDKLKNNTSTTLKNHKLTLEITSNPAWYAVQSLPYLMEYPYECSEQTFSRYYANSLASHILNSNPRIQEVFNQWKSSDALISNLDKNEKLKSTIIQETPWLRDAQSETEQKNRIALLFDLNKMNNDQQVAINKLKEMQFGNGGFPWFKGSNYPNRYITQHIATGYGHLKQLNVAINENTISQIILKAVSFLDEEILDDYNKLLTEAKKLKEKEKTKEKGIKAESDYLAKNHLGPIQLHYLYMRSFYDEVKLPENVQKSINYYTNQSATYWIDFNLYSKGLISLIQHRNNNTIIASSILKSLKENSITSEELGMYWKENTTSWYWYQAPIETQALLIEAFSEIENDISTVDELKIWLLKNKQTNNWKTTKATTEAVYALLLQGSDWLSINETVEVTVGNQKIEPSKLEDVKIEVGTGYYKTSWNGTEIHPNMGDVTLSKKDKGIAWGSLYWQYFEDLDKITYAETPLKLNKKLFLKSNSETGKLLTEISETSNLKIGDLITVRVELKVDRAMEFLHLKDMRASGLEPINVLSQYKWQDGLGYYESTKDASTNFFFENLPKGVYVFEYDLRVNNAGNFSNGITNIQSMYAPEFSSHSEGVRIKVN